MPDAPVISPDEARGIARDACVYGFPLVDSYRIQYSYFVDRSNPEFKAPWNTLHNTARVYTPDDKAIQTLSLCVGSLGKNDSTLCKIDW